VRRALVFLSLLAFGLIVACTGSRESDLYFPPSVVAAEASDGLAPVDEGGGTLDSSTVPLPEADIVESGEATVGDGEPSDSIAPPATMIPCGVSGTNKTCSTADQVCCVTFNGGPKADQNVETCSFSASDCSNRNGATVHCTSSTQCPAGQVCCGTSATPYLYYSDVSCRPSCDTKSSDHQFCDPAVPADCPLGQPCQPSTILTAFYICFH
jgi:hypothetical protein